MEVSSPSTKAPQQNQGLGLSIICKNVCGCIYACVYMGAYCIQKYVYVFSEWMGNVPRLSTWKVSLKCII